MSLPVELTDKIIDELACAVLPAWPFPRQWALKLESSLALVSQAFRERTNTHRFAHVSLVERGNPYFISKFLPILHSDVWTPRTGVARHIRRFELCLELWANDDWVDDDGDEHSDGQFGDGHVKEMLNTIFRGTPREKGTPRENRPSQTLVLTTHDSSSPYCIPIVSRKRVKWRKMDRDLRSTLQVLLKKNPNIIRLELDGFTDIPLTLLTASWITQLSLRHGTFKPPNQGQASERLELGQLQCLEVLELNCKPLPSFAIVEGGRFRSLRKLTFNVDVSTPKCYVSGKTLSSMLAAIVRNIAPTCDLEISFCYDCPDSEEDAENFRDILVQGRYNYAAIDAFLHTYSCSSHSTIVVRFIAIIFLDWEWLREQDWDFETFSSDGQRFFQKYFPLMNKGTRRKVFNIQTSEDRMYVDGVLEKLTNGIEISSILPTLLSEIRSRSKPQVSQQHTRLRSRRRESHESKQFKMNHISEYPKDGFLAARTAPTSTEDCTDYN